MKREESQNVEYKESWHDKHLYGFTDEQLVAAVDNSEYGVAKDVTQTAKPHHDTHHDTHHDEQFGWRGIWALATAKVNG